jgi:hypothetical protein
VRSFHDPLFAQSLRLIAALPDDAKGEQLRSAGAGMEDAVYVSPMLRPDTIRINSLSVVRAETIRRS